MARAKLSLELKWELVGIVCVQVCSLQMTTPIVSAFFSSDLDKAMRGPGLKS